MNLHNVYVKKVGLLQGSSEASELVRKPAVQEIPDEFVDSRIEETRRITDLLDSNKSFSFLRLGDMELTLLLAGQDKLAHSSKQPDDLVSGTTSTGTPGIGLEHINRLRKAFEQADYVDFHELLVVNETLLEKLQLQRSPELTCNPTKWTSYILPLWVEREFQSYCSAQGRNCGIAGAEASLLDWLSNKHEFLETAKSIWPQDAKLAFHQLRNNGKGINENLDLIKDDLKRFVEENALDTLFLSMGGGAKILCVEIANECGIRTIDFGAITRAFCDLGSDGHQSTRSSHSIDFYRLPCRLVLDGLLETRSDFTPAESLARVHAQVIHQLLPDRKGLSRGGKILDLSSKAKLRFNRALSDAKPLIRRFSRLGGDASKTLNANFHHFCGIHSLTAQGICFFAIFRIKTTLRRLLRSKGC